MNTVKKALRPFRRCSRNGPTRWLISDEPVKRLRSKTVAVCIIMAFVHTHCTRFNRRVATDDSPTSRHPVRTAHVDIYERVRTEFKAAAFFKPRGDANSERRIQLAPLIVQEAVQEGNKRESFKPFGAVSINRGGFAHTDVSNPTVYVTDAAVTIHGMEHDQIIYVWWYPPHDLERTVHAPTFLGIRLTLDSAGFPLVAEVLEPISHSADKTQRRMLFVSESLEREAGDEFGSPMPGRHFAIERRLQDRPDVVVPRVIPDGPVPMGPYVYIADHPIAVTTLLCRCSPSQVDRFVETAYYDLEPLESLGRWGFDQLAQSGWLIRRDDRRKNGGTTERKTLQLEELLRLPTHLNPP